MPNRKPIHLLCMAEIPSCVPKIKWGPYLDKSRKQPRWKVILENGVKVAFARYVFMVKLACTSIPKQLHIHHKDEDTLNDAFENLELIKMHKHGTHHNPKDPGQYGVSRTGDKAEYQRRWRKANRHKNREYKRRDYAAHKERVLATNKRWRDKNKEARNNNDQNT